jgi:hypothetical protein
MTKMAARRSCTYLARMIAAWAAVAGLMASEYHGHVKAGGLPLPGATVTAIQGETKVVTTTDDQGAFQFPDLADGIWAIEVQMLGFAKITHEVGVARVAPSPEWEMKILSPEALVASLTGASVPAAPANGHNAGPQREQAQAQMRRQQAVNGNSGRTGFQAGVFQRLDVNQTAATSAEGGLRSEEAADLGQSAANSFIVQGSVSSALGMPQQNDWEFGHRGMGMELGGGPGMMGMPGMAGPTGDGPPGPERRKRPCHC